MSEEVKDNIIEDEEFKELEDGELIPGRLVTAGEVRKWKKEYPHSRLIYFEYFDKPYILRSYQYSDLEKYNAKLASILDTVIKKAQEDFKAKNPTATEDQLAAVAQSVGVSPKDQSIHFLEMVMLFPSDLPNQLREGTIDAGLPQTIMDLASKGSGFATVDADVISEEV